LVKEGGRIGLQVVEAERAFLLGTMVSLSNPDIGDALFSVWNVGLELKAKLLEHIGALGLDVTEKAG
jgi:hypothetical protein